MIESLQHTPQRVVTCYDMLDVAIEGGVYDFTDGMYRGNPRTDYETAQRRQAEWLLDQVECGEGSFILDIGCGYGRILETAESRRARAWGITVSPQQQVYCATSGLHVNLMDYREIPEDWDRCFSGVIANGSLEHFAQVEDAVNGTVDEVYRGMFETVHRITRPGARFATTAIHSNREIDPLEIAKGAGAFRRKSANAHFARILNDNLGGGYPMEDQLERCAEGLFRLERREDGTQDYRWTSEEWLADIKRGLLKPRVLKAIAGKFLQSPRDAWGMLDTWLFAQSWMWQFREDENGETPTRLYRDVWHRVD